MKSLLNLSLIAVLSFYSCKKENTPPEPLIDFNISFNSYTIPDTLSFHATVQNAYSVKWDFGDGQTATGTEVTHIYTRIGFYAATATAIGDGGSLSRFKYVNVSPYTAVRIMHVNAIVPPLRPDGTEWDNDPVIINSAPDPRVIILNSAGGEIMNDHVVRYNSTNASFGYSTPPKVTDLGASFMVQVYDYDSPSGMDYIGSTFYRPADYMKDTTGAFPTAFTKNTALGLSVLVNVVWGN